MNYQFIHTSAYASGGLYPSDFIVCANFDLHAAPEILSQNNALSNIITITSSVPNYVHASVQSFYLHLVLRYELPLSHENISKSLKGAGRNAILMLSQDTKVEYSIDDGGADVWPSSTNIYFPVNFSSIFMLNIMCTLLC